jgi:hypothetical protein
MIFGGILPILASFRPDPYRLGQICCDGDNRWLISPDPALALIGPAPA